MASIWKISSPSLFCYYSLSRRKSASCKKELYSSRTKQTPRSKLTPQYKLVDATMETIVRRSANYEPSLWSYDFFQSLSSKYAGEKYMEKLQTLKEEVRTMIQKENQMAENPLSALKLVDDLQRLGVSYHFVNEISNVLETIYSNNYKSHEKWTNSNMDLNLKSLGFRLLRQHGYHIPQEIFDDVIDENGNFNGHLYKDIFGMLNLFEASFLSLEAENILDAARDLTTIYMKESLENIVDQGLASLISHALAFPQHWMVPRVEAKWFIEAYERRTDMNPTMLELAKLDFNMVQAIHQDDLKHASSWWKKTCWEKFSFGRDRLVENFMWTVAENYLPNFQGRVPLTKVIAMVTTIDDVYDVYGTLQELKQFTHIVNSWNVNEIEELPDYMKICFLELYNSTNETSYNILTNKGVFVLPYLKKAWQDVCNSFIIEAQWYKDGYTPTFNEFMNNASVSIGMSTIIRHDFWFSLNSITEEAFDQHMEGAENMIRNASLIVRLMNDMGTSSDELERGDVPKSIQCYMHESGATEVEARTYIKQLIIETWKKLNKERHEISSELSPEFVESIINLARMGHFMYTNGDKHGKPEITKPYVLSMFVNPI